VLVAFLAVADCKDDGALLRFRRKVEDPQPSHLDPEYRRKRCAQTISSIQGVLGNGDELFKYSGSSSKLGAA
jgi:hypothetical protein